MSLNDRSNIEDYMELENSIDEDSEDEEKEDLFSGCKPLFEVLLYLFFLI